MSPSDAVRFRRAASRAPFPRLRRWVVLMLVVCTAHLAVPAGGAVAVPVTVTVPVPVAAGELGAYRAGAVYSAGVSSGGYMATQLHVAYSGTFAGSAAFASGPYGCARNDLSTALYACMDTVQDLRPAELEQTARSWSAQGLVDPVANLAGDPVYVFSGSGDPTVKRPVADALAAFYGRFGARVRYDDTTAAGHAWISPRGPNSCTVTQNPWLNDCGIDAEGDLLGHLLGPVAAPAAHPAGTLVRFDQNRYAPGGAAKPVSMDEQGFLYVPAGCAAGAECRLVVALHGCKQGHSYQGFGTRFVENAYLNEYADTNDLLVLYPQAVPTATPDNPNGCWNWWGYLGDPAYARHGGRQLETVMNMVRELRGRGVPPGPERVVIASTDAQDGYVKAAADGSGAVPGTLEDVYGLAVGRGSDGRFNRAVLSFDTSLIPAGREVTRAWVTVTRSGGSGDPWSLPAGNRLLADVRTGCFGGSCAVEGADWAAAATAAGAAEIGSFAAGPEDSTDVSAAGLAALARSGTTQIRLRFQSGQTATAYAFLNRDSQATLTVEYR
ncbi:poly(3-hydroxybutyrate) depolymerase [Streptomyces bambusae]|uniref:extracellular catalytic domain type 2 short-chain-length polyhydroxyalkanoate depolymerase n=1 Tax=Streptomyces bambusae TaxID=1550616 RepID=UPI001CFC65C5|nr:PHB depolymerase family esterase [Streptomyces bambusae]MCB5164280.1 poly(3-hydroxybutyrate) depolymerase [Streptomyces bambusae]